MKYVLIFACMYVNAAANYVILLLYLKVKVKQSCYRPGVAQKVPGS